MRDSTVVVAVVAVVAVVRTRPRAIPLAMITIRKSIHGFSLVSYMVMGLRLAALWAAGAPISYLYRKECDAYEYKVVQHEDIPVKVERGMQPGLLHNYL